MTDLAQQPCERTTKETDLEGVSKSVPLYALIQGRPATPEERYAILRTWRQVRQGIPTPADTPAQPQPEPGRPPPHLSSRPHSPHK